MHLVSVLVFHLQVSSQARSKSFFVKNKGKLEHLQHLFCYPILFIHLQSYKTTCGILECCDCTVLWAEPLKVSNVWLSSAVDVEPAPVSPAWVTASSRCGPPWRKRPGHDMLAAFQYLSLSFITPVGLHSSFVFLHMW